LFNPIGRGGMLWLNFLGDFERANRRMHNKSLTADNQVSIVGGRNIAEEYFELKAEEEFRDLSILAAGSVAAEIGATFDRFWNHALSVPIAAFGSDTENPDLEAARAEVAEELGDAMRSVYAAAMGSELAQDLVDDRTPLFPAKAEVITDDPEKLLNKEASST
jgi:putative cardiolipin synthase